LGNLDDDTVKVIITDCLRESDDFHEQALSVPIGWSTVIAAHQEIVGSGQLYAFESTRPIIPISFLQ